MDFTSILNTFVMSSILKDSNPMYTPIIVGILGTIGYILNTIITKYPDLHIKIYNYVFGYTTVWILEEKDKTSNKMNNKLLIDAILCGDYCSNSYHFHKCSYEAINKRGDTNVSKTSTRDVLKSNTITGFMNNKFRDGDMYIDLIHHTKHEKTHLGGNNYIDEEKTYRKVCISSKKSYKQIVEYMKLKRDTYIDNYYEEDENIYIYELVYADYSKQITLDLRSTPINYRMTFDDIFVPNKSKIVQTVLDFKNKTGIYTKRSVKNKLGIMLSGIPGTGKTSIVKLIAKELNRHIFPIKIEKINSIDTLKKLMNGDMAWVDSYPKYVPVEKRLYVFEEIDTAGPIVMDRDEFKKSVSEGGMFVAKYFKDKVNDKVNDKDKNKDKTGFKVSDLEIDSVLQSLPINLGDVLTILDGIYEYDNFAYIMTTNKKDFLDPALYRPGRINLDIELGFMQYNEIKEMLESYYGSNPDIDRLAKSMDDKYTPAQIEVDCQQLSFVDILDKYLTKSV